jgi:NADH-ubiquinone oxidoreductase chain 5
MGSNPIISYFIKSISKMYLTILIFPLCGCIASGLFGRHLGAFGSGLVSTICCGFSSLISLFCFYEVVFNYSKCILTILTWIKLNSFFVNWGFLFDTLSIIILFVVTFISFLVHMYSIEYIGEDPHLPRFMSYISLFTFFILVLVSSDNFLQIFLGWEGIGLSSYLLINFWFTRIQANKAGIKAIVVNRVGDFGLALSILGIYISFETIEYASVFALIPALKCKSSYIGTYYYHILDLIGFLLFWGACGKSAQLGLHTWLPDAIEGPTPVSALIHAATLVTGGVFLLARCSPLLEYAPGALAFIILLGGATAFFAGTIGLVQNDIKRVIAYSTCSQLGYIIFACGCSQYHLGVYHLANHAFFKALLFLAAGSLIHGLENEQDIRKIGGLRRLLPFTYSIIVIGSFSLIGLPFLTGFYSKDSILEGAYAKYSIVGHFAYQCGSFAAFLTGFYSLRILYLCFLSRSNGYRPIIVNAHESSSFITLPLGLLAIPSIFCGYLIKDIFIGFGSPAWSNSIFIYPYNIGDSEFLPEFPKVYPVLMGTLGGVLAFFFYLRLKTFLFFIKRTKRGKIFYNFLNRKWFFDKIYNVYISQVLLNVSYHTIYKTIDKGVIENIGPINLSILLKQISEFVSTFQKTGNIYRLALFIVIGLLILTFILLFGLENVISWYFLILSLIFFKTY